jgi:Methyltransferase domain
VWIMENFPLATLIDVDNFSIGDGMPGEAEQIEQDYHAQMDRYIDAGRAKLYKESTYVFLRRSLLPKFDCIYVDAYHSGPATMTNAVMSWDLLNPGGVMGFDDYRWVHPEIAEAPGTLPGASIDAFCSVFADLLDVLPFVERHPGAGTEQLWVRKR